MTTIRPEKSIVPIVRADNKLPVKELLGTGFFIGSGNELKIITANHVFADNPLQDGEKYGIVFREEKGIRILAVQGYYASNRYDVAVLDGSGFSEAVALKIAKMDPPFNADVFSYEYSSTRIEKSGDMKTTNIKFEPLAHKGNIMTYYESDYPEVFPVASFLTSFPALQGASGAPVYYGTDKKDFAVAGMLVANVERHLLPAQVVTVFRDDGSPIEEIKYFLPLGKGISRTVIIEILEGLKVNFEYAE